MSRLRLRLLEEKDIQMVRGWRNKFANSFFSHDYITKEQQQQWYYRYKESEGKDYFYIIQLKTGEDIGTISLYNISVSDRIADVGRVMLLEEYRGNGYVEEALNLLLDVAFEDMRLYKLRVSVFLDNVDAISIYAKCGFKSLDRPVMIMERVNRDNDVWLKPIGIKYYDNAGAGTKAYDDTSKGGYEGQATNVK